MRRRGEPKWEEANLLSEEDDLHFETTVSQEKKTVRGKGEVGRGIGSGVKRRKRTLCHNQGAGTS